MASQDSRGDRRLDAICAAAMEIADRDGLARLTIRGVAQVAGVPPMTTYGAISSKSQLIGLIAERALDELTLSDPGSGSWREDLVVIMDDFRALLLRHPSLPQIFASRRVSIGAMGLATFIDRVLEELDRGQIVGKAAVGGFFNLLTFTLGYVLFELPRRDPHPAPSADSAAIADPEEVQRLASEHSLIHLGRYAAEITRLERDDSYQDGVRALLDGLIDQRDRSAGRP